MNRVLARLEFAPHRLVPGALTTALFAASAAGAPFPSELRLLFAVAALALWPGAMVLRFLLGGSELEWPERIAYAFAIGLLLAQGVALVALFGAFDPGVALGFLPLLGLALACVRRKPPVEEPAARGALPWVLLAGWLVVLAATFGALGAPLMSNTDSPDHIATVRRIMDTRVVLPTDAFFADAGPHGADPRKGLYHAWVALVARGARLDAVETWRLLPLALVPLLALAFHALTVALTGSRTAALLAAVLLPLVYGGGPGGPELRETVYSTRVGELVALLAAAALVRFVELGGKRRAALFWATGACAVLVHVWYALYFAIALGAYALGVALARRNRTEIRRLAVSLGGLVVITLPWLLYRAAQVSGPQNAIHTEPQGLLYLSERWFVVDPLAVFAWTGLWLVVVLSAFPWFWSRRAVSTGAIYLAVVPAAVVLIVLNPLVLPLVQSKVGYLTMRFVWIVPVVPALATIVTALGERFVRSEGAVRAWAATGLAACALALAPAVYHAATLWTERRALRTAEAERGPLLWRDLLEEIARWPGPRVFLSDLATNYSIPAYTGHHVSAYLDQHSTPNDPKGLERILDARDALSPYVGLAKTLSILREYRVDYVVLNQRLDHPTSFDYWTLQPALYDAMRAKFDARPDLFKPAWTAPRIVVYEVTPEARHGALPPDVEPARPYARAAETARGVVPLRDGAFLIYGTRVTPEVASPGDTLTISTAWAVAGDSLLPPGSYQVFVRFETPAPRGAIYAAAFDKLHRKLDERLQGTRWRMREAHLPLGGIAGPDQWRFGEIVDDETTFAIPHDAAPGRWDVRVRMIKTPHYVNLGLRDYVSDDDRFNGPIVAHVTLVPRAQAAGARP